MEETWLKKQKKDTLIRIILDLNEDLYSLDVHLKKLEKILKTKLK